MNSTNSTKVPNISVNIETEISDAELDKIRNLVSRIISNFQHLFPNSTSAEELKVLGEATCYILKSENVPINNLGQAVLFRFIVSDNLYANIKNIKTHIEVNILKKSKIVFKWIPGFWVAEIHIQNKAQPSITIKTDSG